MAKKPNLLKAALWYASTMGWQVVPLHTPSKSGICSCKAGTSCTSAGKHPRPDRGAHEATSDRGQILDWWRTWPDANVGIVAGEASGVVVVDIDPRNGGVEQLKEFVSEHGKLDNSLVAVTGGGGRHYYCRYTSDAEKGSKPSRGIDVKSNNGIVVVAPSLHTSGKRYRWRTKPTPSLVLQAPPVWALSSGSGRRSNDPSKPRFTVRGSSIEEGTRNNTLARFAGMLHRLGSSEMEKYWVLKLINSGMPKPLPEHDVRNIAHSIDQYPVPEETLPLNDRGYALRLLLVLGGTALHTNSWIVWRGTHWDRDGAIKYVRETANSKVSEMLEAEADAIKDDDKLKKSYRQAAAYCASNHGTTAIVSIAESLEGIDTKLNIFDTDPWLFNVQNGTIDLRTGKLRKHRKEDLLTKVAPVTYDKEARPFRFASFLKETFENDIEMVRFMRRLFGYCLTGDVSEQKFPVFWGSGGNGKSKLVEDAVESVFGSAYSTRLTAETLLDKRFSSHPTELMDLRSARLAVASESKKRPLDEEMIKQLTGGDMIKARRMHKDPEQFAPTHKLILITNNKPRASGSDAIWRRLLLVPFTYKVPLELKDTGLGDKLRAESSGILNWMIRGCLEWQEGGLKPPAKVLAATESHRIDQDVLGQFLTESVAIDPVYKSKVKDVYDAYKFWCVAQGVEHYLGKMNFNRELAERVSSLERYRSDGEHRWRGLKLRSEKKRA